MNATREIPLIVVVPPRVLLLDLAGPLEVLRKANQLQQGVRFSITYVGPARHSHSSIGLRVAGIAPLPRHVVAGAMVLVAGSADEPYAQPDGLAEQEAAQEEQIVAWLARIVRPGVRLVTICAGALLAARAGLLAGCTCTTHHASINELRARAPDAHVCDNRLFVEDGERLTSAGVTAGIDLMLAIVAREAGHAVAVAVARYLVVYLRRAGADPQLSPWLEGRNHLHPAVHRAQDAIAGDPARAWSVAALARVAATSPRNLSRLFNEHTGSSVTDYTNRIRLALAHELLTGTRLDMEQVAQQAGFSSARQLRRAWSRVYTHPPGTFRQKTGQDG